MELYRYISFEEFVNLITVKKLHYVCPTEWEDTYEGYLFRMLGISLSHKKELLNRLFDDCSFVDVSLALKKYCKIAFARYHWYGQCWTKEKNENDAFWRIYSHNNRAIRISTTTEALDALFPSDQYYKEMKSIIYENESGNLLLEKLLSATLRVNHTNECFFHKRKAFSHEKEYRVLVSPKNDSNTLQHIFNKANKSLLLHYNDIDRHLEKKEDFIDLLLTVISESVDAELIEGFEKDGISVPIKANIGQFLHSVMVHPRAETWYVELVKQLCAVNAIQFMGKSSLYKI